MAALGLSVAIPFSKPKALKLGPELLSNGGFGSDTVWTKGTGWSISGGSGVRAFDAASGFISQPATFVAGRSYVVTWTLKTFVSGVFAVRFTGGTTRTGPLRSSVATYSELLLANTGNVSFEIIAGGGGEGSIDNISLREVLS